MSTTKAYSLWKMIIIHLDKLKDDNKNQENPKITTILIKHIDLTLCTDCLNLCVKCYFLFQKNDEWCTFRVRVIKNNFWQRTGLKNCSRWFVMTMKPWVKFEGPHLQLFWYKLLVSLRDLSFLFHTCSFYWSPGARMSIHFYFSVNILTFSAYAFFKTFCYSNVSECHGVGLPTKSSPFARGILGTTTTIQSIFQSSFSRNFLKGSRY